MSSSKLIYHFVKLFFPLRSKQNFSITSKAIKKILIVRQHNQFGDLLASVSLLRAIKIAYPNSSITVIVSPDNYYALTKNKLIYQTFLFNKKKLKNPVYVYRLFKILKNNYDICIVPVTVSISTTSCLLAGLSDAKFKIGPAKLEEKENRLSFLFDKTVEMNWDKNPDRHVADFGQDILQPLGIRTGNLKPEISFDSNDLTAAEEFLNLYDNGKSNQLIIGLHVGAGKILNRWESKKFAELINLIAGKFNSLFYLTGTSSDLPSIDEVMSQTKVPVKTFLNKTVPEVAALISKSDLFITNDTGIMHVAGAVKTAQISIFGPTNPNNWAPAGENKFWIKKGNDINFVQVNDVLALVEKLIVSENY